MPPYFSPASVAGNFRSAFGLDGRPALKVKPTLSWSSCCLRNLVGTDLWTIQPCKPYDFKHVEHPGQAKR